MKKMLKKVSLFVLLVSMVVLSTSKVFADSISPEPDIPKSVGVIGIIIMVVISIVVAIVSGIVLFIYIKNDDSKVNSNKENDNININENVNNVPVAGAEFGSAPVQNQINSQEVNTNNVNNINNNQGE